MKNNFLLFSFLVFLQIFVLNKILFFKYIVLAPFILVLLLYRYKKDSKENLILGFLIGLFIDIFNDSLGVYSLTSIVLVYFRNLWVLKIIGQDKTDELSLLSIRELGRIQFLFYSSPIVLLFFILLSFLKSSNFLNIDNLLTIILSTIVNIIFMIIFQYLFLKSNIKNEWR